PNMHPQDGRVISNFIMQALKNKPITLYGDGAQTRSFQYVDDLVNAIQLFMAMDPKKVKAFFAQKDMGVPVVNVGNPGEYTIKQLAEETLRQLPESRSQIVFQPLPKDDPKRRKPDIALAQELLGWTPEVPLREGLARTINYFRTLK
ncbi:MAG: GDP-mannose 4,6-dehydratase, partial [Kiritimatiellae bacterium]|nr:GDP-mannose 4,6-dehydratase [Kiritimatiellia bacterium]